MKTNLIDLEEYEEELFCQLEVGTTLRPPPTIPSATFDGISVWTKKQLDKMKENRIQATQIYNEMLGK